MQFLSILIHLIMTIDSTLALDGGRGIEKVFPSSITTRVAFNSGLELDNLEKPRIELYKFFVNK